MTDAASPFVTFYNQASGERIELSGTTFDNWVAKTANFLHDDFDVTAGANIGLELPPHWLTPVWIAAIGKVGSTVLAGPRINPRYSPLLDAVVVGPDSVTQPPDADEVIACSLRPLGLPFSDPLPPGVVDYSAEVRAHGDYFGSPQQVPADQPVLVIGTSAWQQPELLEAAAELAHQWGVTKGGRLLVNDADHDRTHPNLWLAQFTVPIVADCSVVIVRNATSGELDHIAQQEQVTAIAAS